MCYGAISVEISGRPFAGSGPGWSLGCPLRHLPLLKLLLPAELLRPVVRAEGGAEVASVTGGVGAWLVTYGAQKGTLTSGAHPHKRFLCRNWSRCRVSRLSLQPAGGSDFGLSNSFRCVTVLRYLHAYLFTRFIYTLCFKHINMQYKMSLE